LQQLKYKPFRIIAVPLFSIVCGKLNVSYEQSPLQVRLLISAPANQSPLFASSIQLFAIPPAFLLGHGITILSSFL